MAGHQTWFPIESLGVCFEVQVAAVTTMLDRTPRDRSSIGQNGSEGAVRGLQLLDILKSILDCAASADMEPRSHQQSVAQNVHHTNCSFLLLVVGHLLLVAMHLLLVASCY